MPITERENYLRTVAGTNPEWIPFFLIVSDPSWAACGQEMAAVMARYPDLFPDFQEGTSKTHVGFNTGTRHGVPIRDNFPTNPVLRHVFGPSDSR